MSFPPTDMTSRPSTDRSLFALLGLPERFALDEAELEARHHRLALQLAAQGNEAFRVLSDPCQRAGYLCERHGAPVDAERNTAMPAAFLVEQMSWREDIDEVRDMGDPAAGHRLQARLEAERGRIIGQIADLIDGQRDYPAAALQVRQLMFFDRLRSNLADVIRQMGRPHEP